MLVSRYGLRSMIALGMVLALAGVLALSGTSPVTLGLGMTSLYLGIFATQPAMLVMVTSRAPSTSTGSASSLYLLSCLAGGSIGTLILGPVWRTRGWVGVEIACIAALVVAFALALWRAGRARRSQ
jgi:YNFM family putative membrane transporter